MDPFCRLLFVVTFSTLPIFTTDSIQLGEKHRGKHHFKIMHLQCVFQEKSLSIQPRLEFLPCAGISPPCTPAVSRGCISCKTILPAAQNSSSKAILYASLYSQPRTHCSQLRQSLTHTTQFLPRNKFLRSLFKISNLACSRL